jgi:hypothetical protein
MGDEVTLLKRRMVCGSVEFFPVEFVALHSSFVAQPVGVSSSSSNDFDFVLPDPLLVVIPERTSQAK